MKTAKSKALFYFMLLLFVIYLWVQTHYCRKNISNNINNIKKPDIGHGYEQPQKIITAQDKDKILEQLKRELS